MIHVQGLDFFKVLILTSELLGGGGGWGDWPLN